MDSSDLLQCQHITFLYWTTFVISFIYYYHSDFYTDEINNWHFHLVLVWVESSSSFFTTNPRIKILYYAAWKIIKNWRDSNRGPLSRCTACVTPRTRRPPWAKVIYTSLKRHLVKNLDQSSQSCYLGCQGFKVLRWTLI